jgi:hypothetical protein
MPNYDHVEDSGERRHYNSGMMRDRQKGKGRFDLISPFMLMRLAKHYENGAVKYTDRNWEKGSDMEDFFDSAMRHLVKWQMGMTDEDHLAAAIWNITAIIHFEETGRVELDNRPEWAKAPVVDNTEEPKESITDILMRLHGKTYQPGYRYDTGTHTKTTIS